MPSEPSLSDLLERWHALRQQRPDVTAEELCAGCPDLLGPLKEQIALSEGATLAYPESQTRQETPGVTLAFPNAHTHPQDAGLTCYSSHGEPTDGAEPASLPGYELLGKLGEGGMGIVYKARHVQADRIVALKMILHAEHGGAEKRARFQTEARAVAHLHHPHIVQVYDVGEQNGVPFFSLEYCSGGSLDVRLAGTPLTPDEAAALVEKLSGAMQAAHDANIIHRDLKPANVLLTADGEPKVTDFGLARRLDEVTQTATGAILGTPSYMAPEQADGRSREVGPAADVYALGAILYECLTGRPPFKAATALDTVMQVVHGEPVPVRQLQPRVPRDLETICHKCLQKDPGRRYPSSGALAEDLNRFRKGEAISARPAGRLEKSWRWCRRNPLVAGLIAAIVAVTAAGFGLVTWQWQHALDRERSAQAARREAEEARQAAEQERMAADQARQAAERISRENARLAEKERLTRINAQQQEARAIGESRRAQQALDFLVGLFRVSDPTDFAGYFLRSGNERGRSLTAQDLLDRGAKKLSSELKNEPLVRASLLLTIGDVYRSLGLYDRAAAPLEEAVALRRKENGENHPEYARALYRLGWLQMDRGDYERAEQTLRQALKIQEAKLPADADDTVDTRMLLAWLLTLCQDPQTVKLWQDVVAVRTRVHGVTHPQTIFARVGLVAAYIDQGRMTEAIPLILELVRHLDRQGGDKTNYRAVGFLQQAFLKFSLGLKAQAQEAFESCLELVGRQFGTDHYLYAFVLHELSNVLVAQDKNTEAERRLLECLRIIRRSVGLGHPRTAIAVRSYANLLEKTNRAAEARQLWEEALNANEKQFGSRNRFRISYLLSCARLDLRCGQRALAQERTRAALRLLPRSRGDLTSRAIELRDLGWAFAHGPSTVPDLAESCYREAIRIFRGDKSLEAGYLAGALFYQGELLHDLGRYREAEPFLTEAESHGKGIWVTKGWNAVELHRRLGDIDLARGDCAQAESRYRKSLDLVRGQRGVNDAQIVNALVNRVGPAVVARRWPEAIKLLREAAQRKQNGRFVFYDNPLRYLVEVQLLAGQTSAARSNAGILASAFGEHANPATRLRTLRGLLVAAPDHRRITDESLCLPDEIRDLGMRLPGSPEVAEVLLLALLRLNEVEEAEAVLADLPPASSRAPFAALCRAWAAALRGRAEEARKLYQSAHAEAQRCEPSPDHDGPCKWPELLEIRLLDAEIGKRIAALAN